MVDNMTKYNELTCYWCGKDLEGKKGFFSIITDTIKTERHFCSPEHLELFKEAAEKEYAGGFLTGYKLRPYYGRRK